MSWCSRSTIWWYFPLTCVKEIISAGKHQQVTARKASFHLPYWLGFIHTVPREGHKTRAKQINETRSRCLWYQRSIKKNICFRVACLCRNALHCWHHFSQVRLGINFSVSQLQALLKLPFRVLKPGSTGIVFLPNMFLGLFSVKNTFFKMYCV